MKLDVTGAFLLPFILLFALAPEVGSAQEVDARTLEAHTRVLSHDLLEGRGTASRGESLAALYIGSRLWEYGLEPVSGQSPGYTLPIPLTSYTFDGDETYLIIQSSEGEQRIRPPDFYHPGGAPGSFQNFSGDLLWIGSPSQAMGTLESYGELRGKIAVMGPPWEHLGEVRGELMRRGAVGAIEVIPTDFYDRLRVVRGPVRFALPPGVDDPLNQSPLPRITVGPGAIDALGLSGFFSRSDTNRGPQDLNSRAEIVFSYSTEEKTAYNVGALLPGSDPNLAQNIVVFLAHYDHVGFGEPAEGDSIWNGFVDNASGTAMLLELARVLSSHPPSYSVLFLFTSAEEQGLLGANWFVHNTPVSKDRIAAVINLDGGIPPPDNRQWNLASSPDANLTEYLKEVSGGGDAPFEIIPINSHSDHWPFHLAGIPAYFLYPGSQAEGGNVHTAKDEWRADFPFEGLVRYAETALRLGSIIEDYL